MIQAGVLFQCRYQIPGRTSTIVKEWLEQPAPEAPAVEEAPAEDSGEGEEEKSE